MATKAVPTVRREDLKSRLESQKPENQDREQGFALVNTLARESFEKEHIPHSINIPQGREDEFERRFDKSKEIIVYCASPSCDASEKVAQELADRGFTNVHDYANGMSDWKAANYPVESGRS